MDAHVYQADTRIVLMSHIKVADWRNELRHLELSEEVADKLLSKLPAADNELALNGAELLELLRNRGQHATYAKMSGSGEKVMRTLAALAKAAWEHEVPYSVDEVEFAKGDEYFSDFNTAYTVADGSIE